MRLDAQGLIDGQDLEQERQLVLIALGDIRGKQCLVVLHEIEERSLGFEVLGRKRGVSSHP